MTMMAMMMMSLMMMMMIMELSLMMMIMMMELSLMMISLLKKNKEIRETTTRRALLFCSVVVSLISLFFLLFLVGLLKIIFF